MAQVPLGHAISIFYFGPSFKKIVCACLLWKYNSIIYIIETKNNSPTKETKQPNNIFHHIWFVCKIILDHNLFILQPKFKLRGLPPLITKKHYFPSNKLTKRGGKFLINEENFRELSFLKGKFPLKFEDKQPLKTFLILKLR
jgi:hypothetical protein